MKKFLLSIALFISLLSSVSYSQCPPDDYGFVPGFWVYGGCYIIPITLGGETCDYNVCFCYKISPMMPETDIFLTSVTCLNEECNHDQFFNNADIFKAAGEEVILRNPGNFPWPCPPCSLAVEQIYRIILAPCYDLMYQACYNNWDASCVYEYDVCCDYMGFRHATLINSFVEGECPGGCFPRCPQ